MAEFQFDWFGYDKQLNLLFTRHKQSDPIRANKTECKQAVQ